MTAPRRLPLVAAFVALVLGVLVAPGGPTAGAVGTGTVLGTVTSSSGTPVEDAWVGIWTRDEAPDTYEGDTRTDANGAFVLADVPAGQYVVHVYGTGDDLGTWHPSAASQQAAGAVTVSAGGSTTADVTMIRGVRISGRALLADGSPARAGFDLFQQTVPGCSSCWDDYGDTSGTDAQGRWSYLVHPGRYRARFISNPYQVLYYKNARRLVDATDIVVGTDPVTGIDVRFAAMDDTDGTSEGNADGDPPGPPGLPNTGS